MALLEDPPTGRTDQWLRRPLGAVGCLQTAIRFLPDPRGIGVRVALRKPAVTVVDPYPNRFMPKLASDDEVEVVIAIDVSSADM